jgi:hypothetical protein
MLAFITALKALSDSHMDGKPVGEELKKLIILFEELKTASEDNDQTIADFAVQLAEFSQQVGPQGEVGPEGPQGPQGIQGIIGEVGLQGPTGPSGADGAPGVDGSVGANGVDGANGLDGAQGSQGVQGLPGTDGATGPAGADGVNGLDGQNGLIASQKLNDGSWINGGSAIVLGDKLCLLVLPNLKARLTSKSSLGASLDASDRLNTENNMTYSNYLDVNLGDLPPSFMPARLFSSYSSAGSIPDAFRYEAFQFNLYSPDHPEWDIQHFIQVSRISNQGDLIFEDEDVTGHGLNQASWDKMISTGMTNVHLQMIPISGSFSSSLVGFSMDLRLACGRVVSSDSV